MQSAAKPSISPAVMRFFALYSRMYLRRHLHALRVVAGSAPGPLNGWPVVVCLNHPSWWDPLVALTLAHATFPGRAHYAPIDAAALARYRIFEHLGFFGIEPNSIRGSAHFLEIGRALLSNTQTALWITAEGSFTDVRTRPLRLKAGVGRLAHSVERVAVVPLALEYTFWEERAPEALACWGEPILITNGRQCQPKEWTNAIAWNLERALDRLSDLSQTRAKQAFDVVLSGSAGIGGIYDAWRGLSARITGQRFTRQHGSEGF